MELCPICHSPINVTPAQKEELRSRGVYVWIDDPILTELGLAGNDYKGLIDVNWRHIKEIQDAKTAQEISANVSNRTTFSEINSITGIKKAHINELRKSTEKILSKLSQSNPNINLSRYFNYDRDGTYHGTWEYGVKINDKTEWINVDRTTGFPNLSSEVTNIRAIHIEELRCQIPVEIPEEEPELHGLDILPGDFHFNLRCPTTPPEIEFKIYFDGFDVTPDDAYIHDTLIAEITNNFNKWYVNPLSVGNTTLFASHWLGDWEEAGWYYADVLISVRDYVYYKGDLIKQISPSGAFYYTGSGIGCDGTVLNVEWTGSRIIGQFDGVDFSVFLEGDSWGIYTNYYIGDPPERIDFQGVYIPISSPPEYMSGTYIGHEYRYIPSFSFLTWEQIPDYYKIGNYLMSGYVSLTKKGNWWYELIDRNRDGKLDTYILRRQETEGYGNFQMGFNYRAI